MSDEVQRPPEWLVSARRGHAPNCSSAGSMVGLVLVSAVAGAALLNALADRFLHWLGGGPGTGGGGSGRREGSDAGEPREAAVVRRDGDGAALLAFPSDGTSLRIRGPLAEAALALARGAGVRGPMAATAPPAPLEAHLAVTERCPASCRGCYLSAGPTQKAAADAPSYAQLLESLEELAALGVLEVAFGGGEAVLREDLVELGRRARALGMVPNVTTSGFGIDARRAREMAAVFAQVNVSIDGLDSGTYSAVRGWDGSALGWRALDTLREAGLRVGVNTVLSRANLDGLEALGSALAARGAAEWQWLRYKPAGRGAAAWPELAPDPEALDALWPRALAIEAGSGLLMRWDCALVPFLEPHGLDPATLARHGVLGCPGGDSLLARAVDGRWLPCSFAHDAAARPSAAIAAGSLAAAWSGDPQIERWRARAASPPEPCASCSLRSVCRGGCRIVSLHLLGDALAPDPQCPRVRRLRRAAA
jgi:radical SAM protein with 4Fe4S-binding SPASM domain